MPNRLAGAASTYLLQHADNPVDWWPWGDEAFRQARIRDVPVLLSIGYASCHWCHVMAHESFEDRETAAQINENFVPVKVDREERPDVDAAYMAVVQALTGQGGWPMTSFLTPDRRTFYAGTYFPPAPRSGLPAFRQVLAAVSRGWRESRDEVLRAAEHIAAAVADRAAPAGSGVDLPEDADLASATSHLVAAMDPRWGGFTGAPKFPPAMVCESLLRHCERTGSPEALTAVTTTLGAMARGGIHDQLGGGFARYSVDSRWHVPHFEKMLEDNALLLRLYAHHARLTGSALSESVAHRIGDFLLREMVTDEGGLAASLDADTPGGEGAAYLWTTEGMIAVLGERDGRWAAELFTVDAPDQPQELPGSVLRLPRDPGAHPVADLDHPTADHPTADQPPADQPPADGAGIGTGESPAARFGRVRLALLAARDRRPPPVRDDIVVTAANGLAITALAEAGAALGRPEWVAAAARAARFVLERHRTGEDWWHSSRAGQLGTARAVLADLGDLAGGLLALAQATGDPSWRVPARQALDAATTGFDAGDGRWRDVADASGLPTAAGDPSDGVSPSGASAIADALLTWSALTGDPDGRTRVEQTLAANAELITGVPRAAGWQLAVAQALATGPLQVAVAGPDTPDRQRMADLVRRLAPGGSVIEIGEPDAEGRELLAGRPAVAGRPTVYVCRGFVCDLPVTDEDGVRAALQVHRKSGNNSGSATVASGVTL